jgi:hypothetical protein
MPKKKGTKKAKAKGRGISTVELPAHIEAAHQKAEQQAARQLERAENALARAKDAEERLRSKFTEVKQKARTRKTEASSAALERTKERLAEASERRRQAAGEIKQARSVVDAVGRDRKNALTRERDKQQAIARFAARWDRERDKKEAAKAVNLRRAARRRAQARKRTVAAEST